MTKTRKGFVNPGQRSLFDLLQAEREQRQEQRGARLCVSGRLMLAVREAIRQAPKSREAIAEEMSESAGCVVSVHQVNNWTAERHPHRLPAGLLPAFCAATGSLEPLRVLAEGVETAEQLAFLRERGCDSYQGYFCSRPVPAEAFAALVRAQQAR